MIEANSICYRYATKDIFESASCKLPSHGTVLLLGDNGAGKTTFFRLLLGELKLEKGSIKINHILIDGTVSKKALDSVKETVAYVAQEDDFVDFLNAEENVSVHSMLQSKKTNRLSLLDHDSYCRKNKNQLSNGEKVILSLERAINDNKTIILLDEATDFLDNENTKKIIEIIKKMSKDKLVVIISHDERILEAFDQRICIEEKKLVQNFCCDDSGDEIPSVSASRKRIVPISKKLLKKNGFVLFLSTVLFTLFNSITFFGFNTVTYPFDESVRQSVGTGYYSYGKEYKDVYIENINLYNALRPYSMLSKDELDLIHQNFEIDYCKKFGILTSKQIASDGRIRITDSVYTTALQRGKIENDMITIHLYYYNADICLPYEILNERYFIDGYELMMNDDDFKATVCDSSISVSCALWENETIRYDNKEHLLDFFSNKSKIAFLSPSVYEKKYHVTLPKEINENEMYISNYLSRYYTSRNVNFFDFKQYDLGVYDTSVIDLNDIFPDDTNLCLQDDICNCLAPNEVLISEKNMKLVNRAVFAYADPLIYVDDSNRDDYVNFSVRNGLEVSQATPFIVEKYSTHHLYLWKMDFQENVWFWAMIYAFIFILDKCIICIYGMSYKKSNRSNMRVLSHYLSKDKNTLLFSFPFLIGECISVIFSAFIGSCLLGLLNESLKYNIPPIRYNLYGLLLSGIAVFLDFLLFYLILRNQRDLSV